MNPCVSFLRTEKLGQPRGTAEAQGSSAEQKGRLRPRREIV